MLLVSWSFLGIGARDRSLFALRLQSAAIFGLTENVYVVFTAIGVLAARLTPRSVLPHRRAVSTASIYLSYGLRRRSWAFLHRREAHAARAALENNVPFITYDGRRSGAL
ncbi:hypothetical protein GCM10017559_82910 [Streptosporangium longisporum]|uniref:Uncharacterized protein n=1 Tax=Streptosporangium longisporum TaxID=46187 RepID=A0ABP6LEZ4_9ACTN